MRRLRLLKVAVQATFVEEDTEADTLTERKADAFVVPSAEWPALQERMETERAAQEQAINETS